MSPLTYCKHTNLHRDTRSSSRLDPVYCHLTSGLEQIHMKDLGPLLVFPPFPASSCPTGCGPAPPLWPLPLTRPPWWPLHPTPCTLYPCPCGPNTTSKHPIIWFCLPTPRTQPKATGNSWRVCGPISLGVELTGAPVFVSTFPHYHWIMVIINTARPGGYNSLFSLFVSQQRIQLS